MIHEHAFNSMWWQSPVGIISDGAFFQLDRHEQQRILQPYSWVEFRSPLATAPAAHVLLDAGFAQVDTQIEFRINLSKVEAPPEQDMMPVRSAQQQHMVIRDADLADFVHERFNALPGVSRTTIAARYAQWARDLIAREPAWCLEVQYEKAVQGWFLAQSTPRGLNLALAMLHRDACVSGLHLYQRALADYRQRGARMGRASFSAGNIAVMNIYARLGAIFTVPMGCWLWVRNPVAERA